MNLFYRFLFSVFGVLTQFPATAQSIPAKEYLGLTGPFLFGNAAYNLVWSSHPAPNYYKQEYLASDDSLGKYKKLILLEVATGESQVKDAVAAKIAVLEAKKKSNPVVNFETFARGEEVMLDFLLSEQTADGKHVAIIERNVYRYKSIKDKSGRKAILLLGVSERAYGDDIDRFFVRLKQERFDLINAVGNYDIPEIALAN